MSEHTTKKPEEQGTWRDKTLKVAGYGYLAGDLAMIAAGRTRGDKAVVSGALTWLTGGLLAARYGNPDQEKQLHIQAGKLEHFLKQKGVTIPDNARDQSELLHKHTLWQNIEQFLYEHPSEALNAMYGIGASMLLHKGIKQIGAGTHELFPKSLSIESIQSVSTNFWIGATIVSGALAGLVIKEDPEARKKAEHGTVIDKAVAIIKEKPLRLSSGLYTANNGFLALQAWQDFQAASGKFHGQSFKPHQFSIPQLCIYLFSNTMLMLSSRNQISNKGFSAEDIAKLEDAAAHAIAAQPPEMQQQLLTEISAFMATQKGIKQDKADVVQALTERVTALGKTQAPDATWAAREAERVESEHAQARS